MALDSDIVIPAGAVTLPADMDEDIVPHYWKLRARLAPNFASNNSLTLEWPAETEHYLTEEHGAAAIVKPHEASFYDAISVAVMYTNMTVRRLVQVCDKNDLGFPGLGRFLKSIGGEPIHWKSTPLDESAALIKKYIDTPYSFLVMPDEKYQLHGYHYTPDGQHTDMPPFNPRYLDLARHTKRPIVPATINGLDLAYSIKSENWAFSFLLKNALHLPELKIPYGMPHDWRAVVANQLGISYGSSSLAARLLGISNKQKHNITVLLGPLIPYPADTSQYDAVDKKVREEIQKLRTA